METETRWGMAMQDRDPFATAPRVVSEPGRLTLDFRQIPESRAQGAPRAIDGQEAGEQGQDAKKAGHEARPVL